MKEALTTYVAKFEALSQRERLSVWAAVLLVCVYMVFALAIEPAQQRSRVLRTQILKQNLELEALHSQTPTGNKEPNPDAAHRVRSEELKSQVKALDETLKSMQRDLVSADRMGALLHEMLSHEPGLQLLAMRTLPVAPLMTKAESDTSGKTGSGALASKAIAGPANVYKHGVEITVRGSYASLHGYLSRLERSPWRMFWWRAKLTANEDAALTMVITIYTLSLDKAWLQV